MPERRPLSILTSRVRDSIAVTSITRGASQLILPNDRVLLFYKSLLIAVYGGGMVYFYCLPGAEQGAVNAWHPEAAHLRSDAAGFDFVVGQTLTSAGLPFTRREI